MKTIAYKSENFFYALVVKLVNATDLKSVDVMSWEFDPPLEHNSVS